MQFSGEEWCVSASNAFGVCKPVSAVPDVAPLELPVSRDNSQNNKLICFPLVVECCLAANRRGNLS